MALSKSTRYKVHFTLHVIDIWTIFLRYKITIAKKYNHDRDQA